MQAFEELLLTGAEVGDERHDIRTPDLLWVKACGILSPQGDSALAAGRVLELMVIAVAIRTRVSVDFLV
jgi:hypothetical protein